MLDHTTPAEQARLESLLRALPGGDSLLDVGGREGWIASQARTLFSRCITVDLHRDELHRPSVQASVAQLPFGDLTFDGVLCAEVLEHVPTALLPSAASELSRVTRGTLVIGVPFEQNLHDGEWLCGCGQVNPPYGHVNRFSAESLCGMFPTLVPVSIEPVWTKVHRHPAALAQTLTRVAGYPLGTYGQTEGCIACGRLPQRPRRTLQSRLLSRGAALFTRSGVGPSWLHVAFVRRR